VLAIPSSRTLQPRKKKRGVTVEHENPGKKQVLSKSASTFPQARLVQVLDKFLDSFVGDVSQRRPRVKEVPVAVNHDITYLPAKLTHASHAPSREVLLYIKLAVLDHRMNSLPAGIVSCV
jgi:hypothetical protein